MKKSAKVKKGGKKTSMVIRPGTGSGSRPTGGSTKSHTSEATNNHTMDRVDPPSGWLK